MVLYKNPYISRVHIKNFRNFLDVNVALDHKQVIIGENNVGKTNFLRAIQLILDRDFTDNDRQLTAGDFHDSITNPLEKGEEIEINIQIQGYEHNRKLLAQFTDAVISDTPPTLQFTYKYFPDKDENGNITKYKYKIYKGTNEERLFTSEDRSYINIYVIKALRDVERELKANKNSPLYKLVKQYEISSDQLEEISSSLKLAAEGILELDEIKHIKDTLNDRFTTLTGLQTENEITLRTFDVDTERLLYTLQVYMGLKERSVSELSLGLANILYVSLMLILLKDRTIIPVIKTDYFITLLALDETGLLTKMYKESNKGNYVLKKDIENEDSDALYVFMDEHNFRYQAFTILAVEEPEAHLHPVLQRLIYREVLYNSNTSVIFTTHSTHITSVTPLKSIVHIRRDNIASKVYSTVNLSITDKEIKDIERYIDAKRGEIYFGKGVILVEGITEEYFIPAASNLLKTPLDDYGIIVCNIDSTNFKPYVLLLNALNIPWVLFTDGDYYEIRKVIDKNSGDEKKKRVFHIKATGHDPFYRGMEIIQNLLTELNILNESDVPKDYDDQDNLFREKGCFIGKYTLEVDMMEGTNKHGIENLKSIYNELITGGKEMQDNFETALDTEDFWLALKKIEDNISKGRFAQRTVNNLIPAMVPDYINNGIKTIIKKVTTDYE